MRKLNLYAHWAARGLQIVLQVRGTALTSPGRYTRFHRTDDPLARLPQGLLSFPGSGITNNLVDKAHPLGIPLDRITW